MKKVLILGNGISRKAFADQIKTFEGEIWACNNAFREYPEIITRLTGHTDPLIEAQHIKDRLGYQFDIYAGPMAKSFPSWKTFTVGPKWHRDSGTTMVAQALFEGHQVECAGFDMGGPDVYAFDHFRQDKTCWVNRWSEIIQEWGSDRIHFWGHDHLPFIEAVVRGQESAKKYARRYLKRLPHIDGEEYRQIFGEGKKVATIEKLVKVVYPNGYETLARESIALVLVMKNAVKIVDENPKIPEPKQPDLKVARPNCMAFFSRVKAPKAVK